MEYSDDYYNSDLDDEYNINVKLRVPACLMPTFKSILKSVEGKLAMKRIKVICGICKEVKTYSIHRGVTKVASVVACENCRHFYQKLRRSPTPLECLATRKASCYVDSTFLVTRCKACWAMQVLDFCPHPENIYNEIFELLSDDCKKAVRGFPLELESAEEVGSVSLEILQNGHWIEGDQFLLNSITELNVNDDAPESSDGTMAKPEGPPRRKGFARKSTAGKKRRLSETPKQNDETPSIASSSIQKIPVDEDCGNDPDDPDDPVPISDFAITEPRSIDPKDSDESSKETQNLEDSSNFNYNITTISSQAFDDVELEMEEETLVDEDPLQDPTPLNDGKKDLLDEENSPSIKQSERIRRKKKKVQYYDKPTTGNTKKPPKCTVHGPDGVLIGSGKDLCDCLQEHCVGCHFPCPKCRSPKCGNDCRVNRKWFYEKVEVEGTRQCWYNKFAPKI